MASYLRRVSPLSIAQAAIWVREVMPNLDKMLPTCAPTVRSVMISVAAISRFDLPRAIQDATSRSRAVRPEYSFFFDCRVES